VALHDRVVKKYSGDGADVDLPGARKLRAEA